MLARRAMDAAPLVLAINADLARPASMQASSILREIGGAGVLAAADETIEVGETLRLAPGEARVFRFAVAPPIRRAVRKAAAPSATGAAAGRIAIEAVTPTIDGGRFPAKRIAGEMVEVEANVVSDGHGRFAADLLWRPADEASWHPVPMVSLGNDRYAAAFPLARVGRHLFTIEAWHDPFATLLEDMAKKQTAGVSITLEIEEALALLRAAESSGTLELPELLDRSTPAEQVAFMAQPDIVAAMREGGRAFLTRLDPPLPLEAERPAADFASWYEIFPRSQSGDPQRHGTFRDVIARLPPFAAMGFDVLYFPPIHPIGRDQPQGPQQHPDAPRRTIPAAPMPSAPPRAGTTRSIRSSARSRISAAASTRRPSTGMETRARLRHPVRARPSLAARSIRTGSTGGRTASIRYAENPPKKYQDIVNVDFYAHGAVPGAVDRAARRRAVLGRAGRAAVPGRQSAHQAVAVLAVDDRAMSAAAIPDVMFLAEAFTRPK